MRRALLLALALQVSACWREPRWYVDRIEGAHAVLIGPGGNARVVDTQTLPPDAGEGSWIAGSRRDPAQERELQARIEARRRALAASDDGQPLVLGR